MTATAVAAPARAERSWTHATRVALITLAIVILLAVSFVVGRATVRTTQHLPAIVPATPVTAGQASTASCQLGRPC